MRKGGDYNKKVVVPEKDSQKFAIGFLLFLLFVSIILVALFVISFAFEQSGPLLPTPTPFSASKQSGIVRFISKQDFKDYLKRASELSTGTFGGVTSMQFRGVAEEITAAPSPGLKVSDEGAPVPDRVSTTNVQVYGIDEPDIVKTDGSRIYFSSDFPGFYPMMEEMPSVIEDNFDLDKKVLPPLPAIGTRVIKGFPPVDLAQESVIDKRGDLLLNKNTLIIFSEENIYGFDVSTPSSPRQLWKLDLEVNSFVEAARLYDDKIYLVTRTTINTADPCPIRPLSANSFSLDITCRDIYHPLVEVGVDATYTAIIIDPKRGEVLDEISFVGSFQGSIVYMSKGALYVTYSYYEDFLNFMYDFFAEEGRDLISGSVLEKLAKVKGYSISSAAKMVEYEQILLQYQDSLSRDEWLRIESELQNRMAAYFGRRHREFEKTEVVKISLDGFDILATGTVPGQPLNQFSLDEYEGNLRIATTIGEGSFGSLGSEQSVSDVYILDSALNILGWVQDLGLGERIYAVRFIEDKGYVVTFRETDPFYVLNLTNPKNPQLKGELKIPGYSSYLHPIKKDLILGVGKEGSKVKLSLFDVAVANNPLEKDKYMLDEYWTAVLETHHAFLLDSKHDVFFMPGSKGGYIFSYFNNQLELKIVVGDIQAKRALYINDYMYIIGENKLIVLNEVDWEQVNQLTLQ